jgi:hypothetical protein
VVSSFKQAIKELVPLELVEMYARNDTFLERENDKDVSFFHWKCVRKNCCIFRA